MADDKTNPEGANPAPAKAEPKGPLGEYAAMVRGIGWNERADLAEKADKLRDAGNHAAALEIVNGLVGSYGREGWEAHLEPLKEAQAELSKVAKAKEVVEAQEVVEEEKVRKVRKGRAE